MRRILPLVPLLLLVACGGEVVVVVEEFGRGEDAGDVKLAVSRRHVDTLEVERRRRCHEERCRRTGMRHLWRRLGVDGN